MSDVSLQQVKTKCCFCNHEFPASVARKSKRGLDTCPVCWQREDAGLVRVHFSNGSDFDGWLSRCFKCAHHIDDYENPKPGRLSPPFNCCAWGVLDRIYANMPENDPDYHHTAWHKPDDVEIVKW